MLAGIKHTLHAPKYIVMSRSQSPRLVDMLEFDSDDDFYDKVFEAYKKLYADTDDKTLFLCWFSDNYEMYWAKGSPGAENVKAAVELLGLKGVKDPDNKHTQAWFKASRTEKLTKLAEAGFTVKITDWVDGCLQVV
jgi:hypothetical protein